MEKSEHVVMKRYVVSLGGDHTTADGPGDAVVNADLVIGTPAPNNESARESGWLAKRHAPLGTQIANAIEERMAELLPTKVSERSEHLKEHFCI